MVRPYSGALWHALAPAVAAAAGIRFSYFPTDRAGVSVLTTADVELGGIW
jgi:hypothetical protein